jgi:hypothetical protein
MNLANCHGGSVGIFVNFTSFGNPDWLRSTSKKLDQTQLFVKRSSDFLRFCPMINFASAFTAANIVLRPTGRSQHTDSEIIFLINGMVAKEQFFLTSCSRKNRSMLRAFEISLTKKRSI